MVWSNKKVNRFGFTQKPNTYRKDRHMDEMEKILYWAEQLQYDINVQVTNKNLNTQLNQLMTEVVEILERGINNSA